MPTTLAQKVRHLLRVGSDFTSKNRFELIGQSSNFLHSRVWVFVRKKELSCIAHRKGVSEASLLALETGKRKCRYRISAARCVSELPLYRR